MILTDHVHVPDWMDAAHLLGHWRSTQLTPASSKRSPQKDSSAASLPEGVLSSLNERSILVENYTDSPQLLNLRALAKYYWREIGPIPHPSGPAG